MTFVIKYAIVTTIVIIILTRVVCVAAVAWLGLINVPPGSCGDLRKLWPGELRGDPLYNKMKITYIKKDASLSLL